MIQKPHKNLQLVEYIRFELGKDAQNHSQQLHVAIQAYEVTNTVTHYYYPVIGIQFESQKRLT